ncbi:MAG TPA: NAD(P)-dependent oxidoreductase [Steroidobacteraceae bacterium]
MTPGGRVLVTGAGGFIGRRSLEPLRAAGFDVHAVLSPPNGADARSAFKAQGVPAGVAIHRADLLDAREIDALASDVRATHLLHFAWIATPGEYARSAENYRWLAASTHLLKAFHRCGGVRAVMAGSCAEYDWSRASICHERTTPLAGGPNGGHATPYAKCKIAMSRTLEEFGRACGLSTAWGRIFFQFGPGEDPRRLVSSVIVGLLAGREAACTSGTQVRSFLHVGDVGAAFAALLNADVEGAVNVGSAEPIAIAALLGRIAERLGRPDLLKLGARALPPSEPPLLVPDTARLRAEVGFEPAWTLEGGLDDTIRWWRGALAANAAARGPGGA